MELFLGYGIMFLVYCKLMVFVLFIEGGFVRFYKLFLVYLGFVFGLDGVFSGLNGVVL